MEKRRLFFVIRSLGHGGAERQLIELAKRLDKDLFAVTVATFYDGGGLRPELEGCPGVELVSCGKRGRWDLFSLVLRMNALVGRARPHLIHGYMENANELALLLGRWHGTKVVWGMRASDLNESRYELVSTWSRRFSRWCSRFPDLIIANSHTGRRDYVAHGFPEGKTVVIHNGIDTEKFRPDRKAGRRWRERCGIGAGERVIGMVGRLDPQKDHTTFLHAAARVAERRPEVRFVCVGEGPNAEYCDRLRHLGQELGLGKRLLWLPPDRQVAEVYNGCDVFTLTSAWGEGFANVVGEAMSCGVPVVVSTAGDLPLIVGDNSQVAPIGDIKSFARLWCQHLDMGASERERLANRQRARIQGEFSLERLTENTVGALEKHCL